VLARGYSYVSWALRSATAFVAATRAAPKCPTIAGSALRPWSITCYSTRRATSARAEHTSERTIIAAIQNDRAQAFASKYQDVGIHIPVAFCSAIYLSLERRQRSVRVEHPERGGERDVDLALKLNVLAVFAVFAFVGAILLGAF
jgi:hypothetical protein